MELTPLKVGLADSGNQFTRSDLFFFPHVLNLNKEYKFINMKKQGRTILRDINRAQIHMCTMDKKY